MQCWLEDSWMIFSHAIVKVSISYATFKFINIKNDFKIDTSVCVIYIFMQVNVYLCVCAYRWQISMPACLAQCLSIVETEFIPEPEFIIWLGWLYYKLCISIYVFASVAGVLNLSYHTWLLHDSRVISTLLSKSFSQLFKNFCPHNDHSNIMKYSIKHIPVCDRLIWFYKYLSCSTFLQLWVDVKIPFVEYNF